MATPREETLVEAEFDPSVKSYWLLSGTVICLISIVGIPVVPFFILGGLFLTGKYLDAMECDLTTRSLRVKKGLLNKIEKTVPLDKITDLALYQGPIMRLMDLQGLKIETAGQSSGTGASLVGLVGIKDARAFRDRVLAQRDAVTEKAEGTVAAAAPEADASVLTEIRDAVVRIEEHLREGDV